MGTNRYYPVAGSEIVAGFRILAGASVEIIRQHSGHVAEYRPGIPSTLAVCLYEAYSTRLEIDFVFMRLVIPVVFCEILMYSVCTGVTDVQCVYWCD